MQLQAARERLAPSSSPPYIWSSFNDLRRPPTREADDVVRRTAMAPMARASCRRRSSWARRRQSRRLPPHALTRRRHEPGGL